MWKRILKIPELYIAISILVFLALAVQSDIHCDNVKLTRKGVSVDTAFPINQKLDKGEYFNVSFNIVSPAGNVYDLAIIPDDCVEAIVINGSEISTRGINGRCNFSTGFVLQTDSIQKYSTSSITHFDFTIKNQGGNGGLRVLIRQDQNSIVIIALVLITLLLFCIFKRFKIPLGIAFILTIGIAFRLYFSYNIPHYEKFGHDVDGHVAYVQYIAENHDIPKNNECWTCYHPPVYFTVMSPVWTIASALHINSTTALQWSSTILSFCILLFGYLVLQTILKGRALTLATCIWTFWPTLILSTSRIGNDQLFYLLHILCLWGSIVYTQKRSGKHLFIAALASLVAYWTKSTAIISMGVWVLALLLGYYPRGIKRPRKWEVAAFITFGILLLSITLHRIFSPSDLIGNANSLHSNLKVNAEIFNFVYFDIKSFIEYPFTSPWDDARGRQLFLNYSLKTALFGEFTLSKTQLAQTLATIISCSFLGTIVIAIRGFWKKAIDKADLILIAQFIAFFAALAFLRYKIPFSCSNDFRYILPALLSFIPFAVRGAALGSTKWKVASLSCIATFVISSIIIMWNAV